MLPKRVTMAGTSTWRPFRFSEMKLTVLSDSRRSLMSANQLGASCVRFFTQPSASMSMSPVVELTYRLVMSRSSPSPMNADSRDSVVLNVLSEGSRHAKSEGVIVDGSMLPR